MYAERAAQQQIFAVYRDKLAWLSGRRYFCSVDPDKVSVGGDLLTGYYGGGDLSQLRLRLTRYFSDG